MSGLPAVVDAAADGVLPEWSHVSEQRYAHMQRVAALLGEWAEALGLTRHECRRWRAAGLLHDALREVDPAQLRPIVPDTMRSVTGRLLHGPAVAAKLRANGITDESLLRAVAFHTIGHPELDELGRALFIADYIEPGRRYDAEQLAALRARMPHERDDVLRDVLRARLLRLLTENRPIRPETAAFWNILADAPADGRTQQT